MAGVSRSATLVIAFLMRSRQMGYQDAFNLVKRRRKIVFLMAFRSALILHFWSNCKSTRPRWCHPSKNYRTSQLAQVGTLPNKPKCKREEAAKLNTTKDFNNPSTVSSSSVLPNKQNDRLPLPTAYNINEENIHRFKQTQMPLQDVPRPLLSSKLSLTSEVRSNGSHEWLPLKIWRVFSHPIKQANQRKVVEQFKLTLGVLRNRRGRAT